MYETILSLRLPVTVPFLTSLSRVPHFFITTPILGLCPVYAPHSEAVHVSPRLLVDDVTEVTLAFWTSPSCSQVFFAAILTARHPGSQQQQTPFA